MSYNLEGEKKFAYTIASVKDIGDIIKELMLEQNFQLAIEFLQEERKALKEALELLKNVDSEKYQNTFTKLLPDKLKDVEFAIKFCNTKIVDGDYNRLSEQEEYKYKKKKQELKIKNLKKLKTIAINTKENEFSDYIDKQIEKEEIKTYQA
jgi:hypothetical protein